jgi:hypothetical protein
VRASRKKRARADSSSKYRSLMTFSVTGHVSDLEPSFDTPPSYALVRVSQRLEYPFR